MTITEEKKLLRNKIREARREIPHTRRIYLSEKITARLSRQSFFNTEEVTLLYASMPEEVQLYDLIEFMLDIGRRIAVPFINEENKMEVAEVFSMSDLVAGKHGILTVKKEKRNLVMPESLGLILVPGVAFTKEGRRLGMGGGYYDAFLRESAPTAFRVALAFDLQIVDNIPVSGNDEDMDFIITESQTIATNRR